MCVDGPGLFAADEPGYVPLWAGGVFEGVDLVFFAVVPVVVEVGEAGGDLLEGAAAVGIDGCDGWVVDSSKIYPTKVLGDGLENREGDIP